ncbi:MAG: DsrE family protein [Vulcanimicrobiota bacterium]
MKQKNILVLLMKEPYSNNTLIEELRTSMGVSAGYREHRINMVFTSDAVYALKLSENNEIFSRFLKAFSMLDSKIYIDKKAAEDRNISLENIPDFFMAVDRKKISELYQESDMNFSL